MTSQRPTTGAQYAEEWLQFESMTGGRFNLSGDIESIRGQFLGLFSNMKNMLPPPSPAVKVENIRIEDNSIPVRIYSPSNSSSRPVSFGLFMHSGGWVTGGIEYEDHLCRHFVENVNTVLVSVGYRLAPDHPYPAGLNDCVAAYKWMAEHAASYSAGSAPTYLIGGSAGGNLAIATALKIQLEPRVRQPAAIFASCTPTCDPSQIPERHLPDWHPENFEESAFLDRPAMRTCYSAYGAAPEDPFFSTLLHENLSKLPPTHLMVGNKDPTYDEMVMLHKELQSRAVKSELKVYTGYPHYFFIVPMLQASQAYMQDVVKRIQALVPVHTNGIVNKPEISHIENPTASQV